MDCERGTWAEIDLAAIAYNFELAGKQLKPGTKHCAVVKADAYGHGAVQVAQEVVRCGADFLAVALIQEAVELRKAGIKVPILILGTMTPGSEAAVVQYDIRQAVYNRQELIALNQAAEQQHKKAFIHLAVDTGMRRIGVLPELAASFALETKTYQNIELEGMFSHFVEADADSKAYAAEQFAAFKQAMSSIEAAGVQIPIYHICNSAAAAELPEYQLNMVRQGITLYGLSPAKKEGCYVDYHPVMRIKSYVGYVKPVPAGASVSYGRTYTFARPGIVATVPIGYADGISRRLSNVGYLLVNGHKTPIIGRVCMDQLMLDVTALPAVKAGDEVLVFGGTELPLEQVATWCGTICYEIACNISRRVPRKYVRGI